jgi:hypothetical protein
LKGPEGSGRLRLLDFKTIGTWRRQVRQPYAPVVFIPSKCFWYTFLLDAESTPGPQCGQKDYFNENLKYKSQEIPQNVGENCIYGTKHTVQLFQKARSF